MTVTVRATQVNGIMPRVAVFDANENPVPGVVLAHGDGTFTIQVAQVQSGSDYFIRVSADPTSGKVVGNYDLDVEFGHTDAAPTTFLDGSIAGPGGPQSYTLVVNQTQLFDLLLNAMATYSPGAPGVTLHMVLTDSQGRVVAERTATAGETAGGDPVLLPPGIYRATFVVDAPGAAPSTAMTFRLYGASLTDPIGPALENPTLRPLTATASGDGPTAPLPVLGSDDAPYYWLALSLSNRGGANPEEGQAPAATGAGPIPSPAVTIATVAGPTPDGQSATSLVAMGVVPISSVSGNRSLPGRFSTGSDLVAVSIGVPLIVAGLPVQAGPSNPEVEQPGTLGNAAQEGSCLIIREALDAARTPTPPSSMFLPDVPSPRQATHDRQPVPPDLDERRDESGVGPDLAQAIAILGTAALVYSRLHSGRTGVRIGPPARPVHARHPLMRSRMTRPLTFCYD
jgi:hypothetical protein